MSAFAPFVNFFARVSPFSHLHSFAVPSDVPATKYAFNSTAPTRTVAVAVPMSTYEGCCCCTYDLQHSPSWLLLLLIVDQLVYHAVLLLCHIYHPAHAFYKKLKNASCWVRPIEWSKLNYASCVVHQARSLGVLILYFIFVIKSWKTSAVSTTDWMVETQLCKLRGTYSMFHL